MGVNWLKHFEQPSGRVSPVALEIVKRMASDVPNLSRLGNRKKTWTSKIKAALTKLGHEKELRVYANNFEPRDLEEVGTHLAALRNEPFDPNRKVFNNTEWHYDLHWYTDDPMRPYCCNSLQLAMECEWKKNRLGIRAQEKKVPRFLCPESQAKWIRGLQFGEVKYDFQKLLCSNAELRMMVFRVEGNEAEALNMLEQLELEYFRPAIEGYRSLEKGATFLLVAYYFERNECLGFRWCLLSKSPST